MKIEIFMIFLILATLLLGQSTVEAGGYACGKTYCSYAYKCVNGVCIKWKHQNCFVKSIMIIIIINIT